jgi:hypothetical protein
MIAHIQLHLERANEKVEVLRAGLAKHGYDPDEYARKINGGAMMHKSRVCCTTRATPPMLWQH